jgi:hypothetical protein
MAEYTITAANVDPLGEQGNAFVAGEAINAGEWFYLDPAQSNKAFKAKADTQTHASQPYFAISSAAKAGQIIHGLKAGEVEVDAGKFAGVGRLLAVSKTTAGRMMDVADLVATNWITLVGYSTATNKMQIDPIVTAKQYT